MKEVLVNVSKKNLKSLKRKLKKIPYLILGFIVIGIELIVYSKDRKDIDWIRFNEKFLIPVILVGFIGMFFVERIRQAIEYNNQKRFSIFERRLHAFELIIKHINETYELAKSVINFIVPTNNDYHLGEIESLSKKYNELANSVSNYYFYFDESTYNLLTNIVKRFYEALGEKIMAESYRELETTQEIYKRIEVAVNLVENDITTLKSEIQKQSKEILEL
jgi:hypothetical protein